MKTLEEKIKVMQAYNKGLLIEYRHLGIPVNWNLSLKPTWNWGTEDYRIKGEPKKKVKLYQVACYDTKTTRYYVSPYYYATMEKACENMQAYPEVKVIKLLPHTEIEVEID